MASPDDKCQTPGCGHSPELHHRKVAECKAMSCQCMRYQAPGGNSRPPGRKK